jgi:hypothetical protein
MRLISSPSLVGAASFLMVAVLCLGYGNATSVNGEVGSFGNDVFKDQPWIDAGHSARSQFARRLRDRPARPDEEAPQAFVSTIFVKIEDEPIEEEFFEWLGMMIPE